MNGIKKYCWSILFLFFALAAVAQRRPAAVLSGKVTTRDNYTPDAAVVYLLDTDYSTLTNDDGQYSLTAPPGEYTLVCARIGYVTSKLKVRLEAGKEHIRNIMLEPHSSTVLDEVFVIGKSKAREINESAYNVVAIDAGALRNTTLDV
ncbi:MAG: carboxypeptidase-like regulatory domain-containing protein, partial [Prevotellaceae bacterium]|nr:carboxypeptidase-like regulatory domain-containing protein [Prevotellaceae bacterium]